LYRDRFRIGPVLLLGVVLVTGACGEPADQDTASGSGWSTLGCEPGRLPQSATTTPPALQDAMDRIERAGRAEHADSFAGLEVDQARARAIVYRVPSAAFDEAVREAAGTTCIVVRDAAHSARELAVWHDRVLADLQYWTHQGVRIVTIGARHDGSGVEVGTTDVEKARRELMARYGAEAPLVFAGQAPVRPLTSG
jgi:hypothetical protein